MKKKVLVTLLFTYFLIQGINTPTLSSNQIEEKTLDLNYVTHEAISIYSNDGFLEYGFSGSGSKDNPYIIEGYSISVSGGHCISIFSVSKYFVIRNCLLETTDEYQNACIRLGGVSNGYGTILYNTCSGYIGVYIWYNCVSINVTGNYFHNSGIGIKIVDSSNCFIWQNIAEDIRYGIMISSSQSCTIKNNTIISGDKEGIELSGASNIRILYNYISNVRNGIELWGSSSNSIHHNILENNSVAIKLYIGGTDQTPSQDNIIHHNNMIDNDARPQAIDLSEVEVSTWYDVLTNEGNYWSDYKGSGVYQISYYPDAYLGPIDIHDPYPLNSPVSIIKNNETTGDSDPTAADNDSKLDISFTHADILLTFLSVLILSRYIKRKKHHFFS